MVNYNFLYPTSRRPYCTKNNSHMKDMHVFLIYMLRKYVFSKITNLKRITLK